MWRQEATQGCGLDVLKSLSLHPFEFSPCLHMETMTLHNKAGLGWKWTIDGNWSKVKGAVFGGLEDIASMLSNAGKRESEDFFE